MMRVRCLQHVPFEGPAAIADWAGRAGHSLEITRLYAGEALPSTDSFERLVVMGGPMGVFDEAEHDWLTREKAFLRESLNGGKSVVGICLGAQLLADVLGGGVHQAPHKEIGWYPVTLTEAVAGRGLFGVSSPRFEAFHWHGDTFDIPAGARRLAESEACANQAFLYDERVLGLQFHLESTPESIRAIIDNCGDEIVPGPYIQSADQMLARRREALAAMNRLLCSVLDRLPE